MLKEQVADGLPQHLPPEHPGMDPAGVDRDHHQREHQRGHKDPQAVAPHGAEGQHTPPEAEVEVPARGNGHSVIRENRLKTFSASGRQVGHKELRSFIHTLSTFYLVLTLLLHRTKTVHLDGF